MYKAIKQGYTWRATKIESVEEEAQSIDDLVRDSYPVIIAETIEEIRDIVSDEVEVI